MPIVQMKLERHKRRGGVFLRFQKITLVAQSRMNGMYEQKQKFSQQAAAVAQVRGADVVG